MGKSKTIHWFSFFAIASIMLLGTISAGPGAFAGNDTDNHDGKKKILTGEGTPIITLGKKGSIYIDNTSKEFDIYRKDSKRQWNNIGTFADLAQPQLPAGLY